MFLRSVKATSTERTCALPGDALIQEPIGSLTNAITIRAATHEVWPWLVQMGAGRAGWYTTEPGEHPPHSSAETILPEFQKISVGTILPWRHGSPEGFVVLAYHPVRSLVLGAPGAGGHPIVTWAFVLEPLAKGQTRLIVRLRAGRDYHLHGLPTWITKHLLPRSHFVLQRQQLLGIAHRAEDEGLMAFAPQSDAPAEATTDSAVESRSGLRSAARMVVGGAGLAAGVYAAYAAIKWIGHGHASREAGPQANRGLEPPSAGDWRSGELTPLVSDTPQPQPRENR
jgi:hypothetical protein